MKGRRVGRYEVLDQLGAGGMGSVWLAVDPLLERRVAIKFPSVELAGREESRSRFLREARAACALSHPGIATVFDAGEVDGQLFIALALIEGESIATLLRHGPFEPERAIRLTCQAAGALGHAHAQGILHRDVKSGNIMVDPEDRAIIVDFGLALPQGETRITRTGSTLGTFGYLAPEIARTEPGDHRADLYGLGVVLFEMVTGSLPYESERAEAVLYAVVNQPTPLASERRPGLPRSLDHLLLRMLAKNPDDRHATADDLVADLETLGTGGDIAKPVLTPPPATSGGAAGSVAEAPPHVSPIARPWVAVLLIVIVLSAFLVIRLQTRQGQGAVSAFSSVAVLPLVNQSDEQGTSSLWARGLGENITTKLAGLDGLRVTPWVSSQGYSLSNMTPGIVGRELGVASLVVGTFLLSGDVVQGSLALLDTATGEEVWSTRFAQPLADVLRVQARVALDVARQLRGTLTGREREGLQRDVAASVEAYQIFLQGSSLLQASTYERNREALSLFERALEIEPDLAPAHVGVGTVFLDRYFHLWEGDHGYLTVAEASLRRALEIDPGNARAQRGLVRVWWERSDYHSALALARDVVRGGSGRVEDLLLACEAYILCGIPSEAMPLLARVLDLDPVNQEARWFRVVGAAWSGRFEEALAAGDEYFLNFGEDEEVHVWMGVSAQNLGRIEVARSHFERASELGERGAGWRSLFDASQGMKALGLQRMREANLDAYELQDARAHFRKAVHYGELCWFREDRQSFSELARAEIESGTHSNVLGSLACVAIRFGDNETAAALLRRQVQLRVPREILWYQISATQGCLEIFVHPDYASLRSDYESQIEGIRREYGPERATP